MYSGPGPGKKSHKQNTQMLCRCLKDALVASSAQTAHRACSCYVCGVCAGACVHRKEFVVSENMYTQIILDHHVHRTDIGVAVALVGEN